MYTLIFKKIINFLNMTILVAEVGWNFLGNLNLAKKDDWGCKKIWC